MNISRGIITALLLTLGAFTMSNPAQANDQKPVIALVAFGTSVPSAQKSFEVIDGIFTKSFPEYEIRWAFTSQFIIDKLAKEGQTEILKRKTKIVNPQDLFKNLADAGHKEIWVQSLHVVPGGEYEELLKVNKSGLTINYGAPLLATDNDIAKAAKAISPKFGNKEEFTILAGHGNDHHADYNTQLIKFNTYITKNYKDVELATVEGSVGTENAFNAVKSSKLKKVKFIPFMVVAGDHAMNDVMGDEDDSWKSILGLEASITPPLGQDPAVIAIFKSHLEAILPE